MAQLNRNASYMTVIDGLTTWERLKTVREFLMSRRIAKEDNESLTSGEGTYKDLQNKQLFEELDNEIAFLEGLEADLLEEAEKTRIPGKTDSEMYEINYFEELTAIHILQVQSEVIAMGAITSETAKTILRNPRTLARIKELQLLPPTVIQVMELSSAQNAEYQVPQLQGVTE